jgi:hypothetical protein
MQGVRKHFEFTIEHQPIDSGSRVRPHQAESNLQMTLWPKSPQGSSLAAERNERQYREQMAGPMV